MSPDAGNSTSHPAEFPRRVLFALGLVVVAVYFSLLGFFPLVEPDEARYAEIPREMLERGDWVTPTLNYVKYFEKPPLLYWLGAAGYRVAGVNEFAMRFWPAAFAVAGIALVWRLGCSMWNPRAGALAALVLATTPLYYVLAQVVTLDMPLTFLTAAALAGFWVAYRTPRRRRAGLAIFYLSCALAVLTKGPVAVVLVGAIVVGFLLLRGNPAALAWVLWPPGIALFFAVALPWFVVVNRRNPEFYDFFVVDQHFRRYLTSTEHEQPLWFFAPIVFAGMLPWSLLILSRGRALARFTASLFRLRASEPALFCTLWAAVIFGFFSLSASKLATYVLPLIPPLALLSGRWLDLALQDRPGSLVSGTARTMVAVAVSLTVAALVAGETMDAPVVARALGSVYAAAAALAATGLAATGLARRSAHGAALGFVFCGMLLQQCALLTGRRVAPSYEQLGTALRRQAQADDLVVTYRHYVQGIPFYSRRRTVMANGAGELAFGSRQGDQSDFFWPRDARMIATWRSGKPMFLVINRSELDALAAALVPAPRQVAAQGKKVVVVNFPPRAGENA